MYLLRPKEPNSLESELVAIHKIVRCLDPLSQEQRVKVLQYALTQLGLTLAVTESFDAADTNNQAELARPARH